MRVALIQQANSADREANLATSIHGIQEAAEQGAELVLLQELHAGLYFCQTEDAEVFDQAEPLDGPTVAALSEEARRHGVVIVGSIFERRAAGIYHNTAVVLERDGSVAGIYRKMHIPDDPGYYEKFYFTPGDLGFEPIDTSVGRLGVLVCWDQWYPEAARLMALAGAELLLYPTAIGWHPEEPEDEHVRQLDAWRLVQRGHAVANGLPLLACNRVGPESDPSGVLADAQFWGASFVCGPQGELLAEAPSDAPCVLLADIDMQRSEQVRRMWPFLRDRRIDDYDEILLRYRD
ncbi:MAG: carbon-nitrogen hydrolase [Acidihalobacter sp.]|uniref:carbon-nitrogen hydrolase n=1 Tax=Acidihalobacter sp. TaxID=1872108 RepID=UPI00307E6E8E